MPVYIEDYTSKSFVLRGETQPLKETIKAMGGKWNSSLKNQDGEKFGAWLFWSDKRNEVEQWISKGFPEKERTFTANSNSDSIKIKNLEDKIDYLTRLVEKLASQLTGKNNGVRYVENKQQEYEQDDDSDEEYLNKPMRRLLK